MCVLVASISCDEYIPEFLSGKLKTPFIYNDIHRAEAEASNLMKRFVDWIMNDPSCTSKPVIKRDPNRPIIYAPDYMVWKYEDGINSWFKIVIKEGEVDVCLS